MVGGQCLCLHNKVDFDIFVTHNRDMNLNLCLSFFLSVCSGLTLMCGTTGGGLR